MSQPRDRSEELKQTVYASDPYTAVKHAVYQRYAQCWMGKLLRAPGGAAVIDAFCGAGEYSDGLLGSPLAVARTFLDHRQRAAFNQLDVVCLDERADRLEHLRVLRDQLPSSPRLNLDVMEPGRFENLIDALSQRAHRGSPRRPVLWLLDPYGWADVPVSTALRCLDMGPRDEVIISLFTEEMYRFASDNTKAATFERVFGTNQWRAAVVAGDEAGSKDRLAELYAERLREQGLHVGKFAVAARGHMPRYHLVYATHHEPALLECWNGTTWYLDRYLGQAAGPIELSDPDDLFSSIDQDVASIDRLRQRLESFAGHERTFEQLASEAARIGYKVSHLRSALSAMREAGLAVRTDSVASKSEWPEGSVVRFYVAVDSAT